jgi:hypothetical protein
MIVADLAYDIVPAIVPTYACLVADDRPDAMAGANRPVGLAIRFELDEEVPAAAVASLPCAEEMIGPNGRLAGTGEFERAISDMAKLSWCPSLKTSRIDTGVSPGVGNALGVAAGDTHARIPTIQIAVIV